MDGEIGNWDREFTWHPFTQMKDWMAEEPVIITRGEGVWLEDSFGKKYIDGNSSIWTNVHGHHVPELNAALSQQAERIAHTSFLGFTNDIAPRLARELLKRYLSVKAPEGSGYRVFFSDDGATSIEAGLKLTHQARQQRGETHRTEILSLTNAYHGDTVGAMSAAHSPLFHSIYKKWIFDTHELSTPACYRCPFNKGMPCRGKDARLTRKCEMECVGELKKAMDSLGESLSLFLMEPFVQGAGQMGMQPAGYLKEAARLCRERGVWLMLDEVFTGFGRTGTMFACQREGVRPDVIALAKGLTGGYLPVAATITSGEIFDAFLGDYSELKSFFHGHSYTGNQLGCAVALANLELFKTNDTMCRVTRVSEWMRRESQTFWDHPNVGDVRQEGIILAIELVEDFATRKRFNFKKQIGFRVCEAAKKHSLLTRPVGDVLFLMPPTCISESEVKQMVGALRKALDEVLPSTGSS